MNLYTTEKVAANKIVVRIYTCKLLVPETLIFDIFQNILFFLLKNITISKNVFCNS